MGGDGGFIRPIIFYRHRDSASHKEEVGEESNYLFLCSLNACGIRIGYYKSVFSLEY